MVHGMLVVLKAFFYQDCVNPQIWTINAFPWFIPCLCNPGLKTRSAVFIIAWSVWQKSQEYKSPAVGLSPAPIC